MKRFPIFAIFILSGLFPFSANAQWQTSDGSDIPLNAGPYYTQNSLVEMVVQDSRYSWWVQNGLRVELFENYCVFHPWPKCHQVKRKVVLNEGDDPQSIPVKVFLSAQFGLNGALATSLEMSQIVPAFNVKSLNQRASPEAATPEPKVTLVFNPARDQTPALYFNFEVASAAPLDEAEAMRSILPLLIYLKANPKIVIDLKGHVGFTEPGEPEGEGPLIWAYPYRGREFKNLGDLMLARSEYVRKILIHEGIPPERITTSRGSSKNTKENRKITVHYFDT